MWRFRQPSGRFFEPQAKRQVEVLFDALFPSSEDSPGATDAGATEYLDRLLAMDKSTYYEIPAWQATYPKALEALDSASRATSGKALEACDRQEATALLKALAGGTLSGFPDGLDQKKLFAMLRAHCIEACFADPRWGGNREAVIWKWMGYPAAPWSATHREGEHDVV